ncbi:MAG: TonB-dependent receptor [Ignavibacteriae bacterium]|nr:TonB-dependent receptor [Ignavibacteriota bacterium]
MKHKFYIVLIIIISANFMFAQKSFVEGKIKSDVTLLKNVEIKIDELGSQYFSDENGNYKIELNSSGNYTLVFSHIGFNSVTKNIFVNSNENYELNISLEPNIIGLGEAIVQSSRYDKILKESVIPIEFITKDKIDNSNFITLSDLASNNSGITLIKDAPWGTTINIRGLSKQNIIYLLDGYRIETSTNLSAGLSMLNLNDIENIELVKGGISSLYGSGATGGIINIKSKEPEFVNNFFLHPSFTSSYNSVNNNFCNNLSLSTGSKIWSLIFSGFYRNADDIKTPNGILENSSFKDESVNGKLRITPIENVELNFSYNKYSAYDVGLPGGEPFPETAKAKYIFAKREMLNGEIYFYNISKYLTKTQIKYYHQIIKRSVETRPNAIAVTNPFAEHTMDGFTIQSDWILSNSNILIAGIDYWQRKYEGERKTTNNKTNIITVDKPVPDSKFRNLGIFASDEIELISNKISLTFSGRYDLINITNDETKNPLYIISNGVINTNVRNDDASYSAYDENNKSFSGNFGILYKLNNEIDFTFNSAYTFRSPSLEERYQYIDLGGIKYFGNPNLEPEKGISLDAGFRVWNNNLNFKINTFLNSLSNLVIDEEIFVDSLFQKQNVGKARLYGFDMSFDYNIYSNNSFYGIASYVIGKDLTKDEYLPQIPPMNFIIGSKIEIINEINCDVSANIFTDQDKISNDENRTGGYTTFDFSIHTKQISFLKSLIKLSAGIENIFNKAYRNHLSTFRGINLLEPGRNIFAKINIEIK